MKLFKKKEVEQKTVKETFEEFYNNKFKTWEYELNARVKSLDEKEKYIEEHKNTIILNFLKDNGMLKR